MSEFSSSWNNFVDAQGISRVSFEVTAFMVPRMDERKQGCESRNKWIITHKTTCKRQQGRLMKESGPSLSWDPKGFKDKETREES